LNLLDLKLTLTFSIWEWRKQFHEEEPMKKMEMKSGTSHASRMAVTAALGMTLVYTAAGVGMRERYSNETKVGGAMTVRGQFYCNAKALSPAERARHEELTKRLLAKKIATLETAKGYEFQFRPEDASVAEVAEWVVAESKCCPFFDFHIDLEEEGRLVCLRLTGAEGIKTFIRSEFGLK
jgi:hypothetical protein